MTINIKKKSKELEIIEKKIVPITTQKELKEAIELKDFIKERSKILEAEEKKITKPLLEGIKNARLLFKEIREKYLNAENKIKFLIAEYKERQDRRIEEIAERVNDGNLNFETAIINLEELKQNENQIKVRRVKDIEIYDENQIPKKYWTLNIVALRKDVLSNVEVAGVKIITKEIIL